MKVLLLSRNGRQAAASRYRFYQFLPYLKTNGIDVITVPLRRLFSVRRYELLWIEKELFPWVPAWFEEMLAGAGIRYVVDYDDATFHRYDLHPNKFLRRILGRKIDTVMRKSAMVIACNSYLAEHAVEAGANWVECLPTVIDLSRYPHSPRKPNSALTIGWIGSPSTASYLPLVADALKAVCRDTAARLIAVGPGPISLDGVPMEIREWSEETEIEDLMGFDIGIMPLPESPWARGKCGLKLLQYMGCATPVVGSPVGVNRDIIRPGINGFYAADTRTWIETLETLARDRPLREKMGCAGRKMVESSYSLEVAAPRLRDLLRSAAEPA
jgi:glycosyltransferase involved in cell wall biosynthesis